MSIPSRRYSTHHTKMLIHTRVRAYKKIELSEPYLGLPKILESDAEQLACRQK